LSCDKKKGQKHAKPKRERKIFVGTNTTSQNIFFWSVTKKFGTSQITQDDFSAEKTLDICSKKKKKKETRVRNKSTSKTQAIVGWIMTRIDDIKKIEKKKTTKQVRFKIERKTIHEFDKY